MAAAPKAPNTSPPPIAEAAPVEVSAAALEVCDASLPPLVEDGEEPVEDAPVEDAPEEDAPEEAAAPTIEAVRPVAFVQADGMEDAAPVTKLTGAH